MGIHLMPPLFELVIKPPPAPGAPYIFVPETYGGANSCDGWIRKYYRRFTWAQIISGDGTEVCTSCDIEPLHIIADSRTDLWLSLGRGYFLFDTSPLPDDCVIDTAELHIYVYDKYDSEVWKPNYNIYAANPASNNTLVLTDYCKIGSTPYSDAIAYDDIATPSYNIWTLNSSGRAAIQKAGVTGFCLRNACYDAAGISPTWHPYPAEARIDVYFVDHGVPDTDPRLYVWVK